MQWGSNGSRGGAEPPSPSPFTLTTVSAAVISFTFLPASQNLECCGPGRFVPMDKTIFPVWKRAFPREKALFEAWELQIAEMAGLGTAFFLNLSIYNYITVVRAQLMQEKLEDSNRREAEMKDESIQRQVKYIVRFVYVYICQVALCFEDL